MTSHLARENTRHPVRERCALSIWPGLLAAASLLFATGCRQAPDQLPAGLPALHRAAAQDDADALGDLRDADVDQRGPFSWTPLHAAAIYGAQDAARQLLRQRAHVDALDAAGMTPLHWAARRGNHRVARILLDAKAKIMARNQLDMTPLHEARTVAVARLLLERGADLGARDVDGMTPLHTAPTREVAQFLIGKGANLNARAKDGRTPMDMPPVPLPRLEKQ